MSDLISRQAAIDAIKKPHGGCYTEEAKGFAVYQVLSVPTIDAVELVRCKDCKWWEQSDEYGWCQLLTLDGETRPDWFCADGERKEQSDG